MEPLRSDLQPASAARTRPASGAGGSGIHGMASTALLIAVWAVAAALIQSRYLPGPVEVAQDLWERLL